jgi:hypothetical protein
MKGLIKRFATTTSVSCSTFFALLSLLLAASQTQAAVYTLTDQNSVATLDLGSSAGLNSWLVDGVNQANQQWFWLRVGSGGPQMDLSQISAAPTITFSPLLPRILSVLYATPSYGVQVNYTLAGNTPGSERSGLTESIRLYNYSSAALDFHLFQYWDLMLGGPGYAGAQNVAITPSGSQFNNANETVTGLLGAHFTSLATPSANGAEAGAFNGTLNRLETVNGYSLNGTTSAGPGHLGWALQWDFTVGANSSAVVSSINNLQVPEPSVIACIGLGFGILLIRRRYIV